MLNEKTLEEIASICPLDILIGIPSFNNEDTIGHVAKAIKLGLIKYFPRHRSGLVHLDAQSTDQTVEKMKRELETAPDKFDSMLIINEHHPSLNGTAIPPEEITVTMPKRGKGNALRGFFEIARAVNAKACAVFDSDLRSITPEWIPMMVAPVLLKQFDYVTPMYCRHKYDGTITNSIVYPLTSTLYGKKVRQPIGGEFGFSSRVVDNFLACKVKTTEISQFGIDIWMTTIVLANQLKVCESFLGAKIHNHKDPSVSLAPMFKQVIGTIFQLIFEYQSNWVNSKSIMPINEFGFGCTVIPEEIKINHTALLHKFREGLAKHNRMLTEVVPQRNLKRIARLLDQSPEQFKFPKDLWAKTVYDFAVFYNSVQKKTIKNQSLMALVPLYFGYTASFVNETREASFSQAEELVSELQSKFLALKPYLIRQWEDRIIKAPFKKGKIDLPLDNTIAAR